MEVPPEEFRLPFFEENGFVRRLCPTCRNHYWTQNPDQENCGDAPCVPYSFIGSSPVNRRFTISEMREKFLSFFEERGHKRIAPYPVVARWRSDLMVTIASIVDFQPYVTEGIIPPPANPLVVSQPCLRFEDIDLVGKTAGRHLAIFEMGGHHAFNYRGQPQVYWKDETVRLHHELLTRDLGVPSEIVTYKEGLWSGGGNAGFDLEGCVNGLEISTLVFMMFRVVGERFEPMPIQVVDTGYGMERWTWLSHGTPSAFQAVYGPILDEALRWAGLTDLDEDLLAKAARYSYSCITAPNMRELGKLAEAIGVNEFELGRFLEPIEGIYGALDHTKSIAFILSEGVVPSNVRVGYLARLLYRRAYRLLRRLGIHDRLSDLIDAQIGLWGGDFPQLRKMRDDILEMVAVEGKKYRETLSRGSELVKRNLRIQRGVISSDQLVEFYDSHGLTPEDVMEAANGVGANVTVPEDFYALVAKRHMKIEEASEDAAKAELSTKAAKLEKTRALFYEDPYMREFEAKVLAVFDGRYVVLDQTAFFAEAGGQVSDSGSIAVGSKVFEVTDVQSYDGVLLHEVQEAGKIKRGAAIKGFVDWERRSALMRSHTATHIVLGAARRVLGEHAWQAGAQKGVERSRLDVSHYQKLTREQVEEIERLANRIVMEGRMVACRWMLRSEAEARYGFRLYQGGVVPGKDIRIVDIGDWDIEACGGTHLRNTSEAGMIKVLATERVQDGVERIIFASGPFALSEVQRRERALIDVSEALGVSFEHVGRAADNTIEELKRLRQELGSSRQARAQRMARELLDGAQESKGIKVIIDRIDEPADFLIEVGNAIVQVSKDTISVLCSGVEPRAIVKAGEGAMGMGIHAGRLAKEITKVIGGGGGGDPYFGQAGGVSPSKFDEGKERIRDSVKSMLR